MRKKNEAAGLEGRKEEFAPALSVSHEAMLVDGNDEKFRRLLFLSTLFADRLMLFRDTIAESVQLSGNQYVILLAIAHAQGQGGTTVRDVAKYALMASTHVTTQVGFLVKKGLVKKDAHESDGRSVILRLTPKGEDVMRKIAPLRQEFNDAFFEGVTRGMLVSTEKFLNRVTQNSEDALPLLAGKGKQPQ
jgi:DNA-binding MarR family transcriptional regulator